MSGVVTLVMLSPLTPLSDEGDIAKIESYGGGTCDVLMVISRGNDDKLPPWRLSLSVAVKV